MTQRKTEFWWASIHGADPEPVEKAVVDGRSCVFLGRRDGAGRSGVAGEGTMIVYLVAATQEQGVRDAAKHEGWTRLSAIRFATPERHDVRIVTRIADLVRLPGTTWMLKGADYDEGPPERDQVARRLWFGHHGQPGQQAEFDAFVMGGGGRWAIIDDIPTEEPARAQVVDQVQKF